MEREYAIIIKKIDNEHSMHLVKLENDETIDSLTWEEVLKMRGGAAYLLRKHNIPYEAAGYSSSY